MKSCTYFLFMKNTSISLPLTVQEEKIPLPKKAFSEKITKLANHDTYGLSCMEERLFFIKTQELINEFTYILLFFEELEKNGIGNSEILEDIRHIHSELCASGKNDRHVKIVNVLSRYLRDVWHISNKEKNKGI